MDIGIGRLFQQDYENLIKILTEFIIDGKLEEILIGNDNYSTYRYYQPLPGIASNDAGITDVKLVLDFLHKSIEKNILTCEKITNSLIEVSRKEIDYLFIYLFI